MQVSLSLWSCDQARIADEVQRYDPLIDSFHVDVMDGWFVPDLLFGPLTVQTLRALTTREIVVHLMVREPVQWAHRFADAGADLIVVHPSACADFPATLSGITDSGAVAGAAVGLTELRRPLLENLSALSAVLVMGTPLGVKGQPFDRAALDTVRHMVGARAGGGPRVVVDGGIRWSSVPQIAAAGADGVVAGSVVTSAPDPGAAVRAITGAGVVPESRR
jgi:ribulose-phosphate 3-epimerase